MLRQISERCKGAQFKLRHYPSKDGRVVDPTLVAATGPFFAPPWLLRCRFSLIVKGMEVHFTPETEKKLNELAAQSGRDTAAALVQDVIEGYIDELAQTREMLNGRYDDLKSGKVKPIPGDEVVAYFREKSASARPVHERIRVSPGSAP